MLVAFVALMVVGLVRTFAFKGTNPDAFGVDMVLWIFLAVLFNVMSCD